MFFKKIKLNKLFIPLWNMPIGNIFIYIFLFTMFIYLALEVVCFLKPISREICHFVVLLTFFTMSLILVYQKYKMEKFKRRFIITKNINKFLKELVYKDFVKVFARKNDNNSLSTFCIAKINKASQIKVVQDNSDIKNFKFFNYYYYSSLYEFFKDFYIINDPEELEAINNQAFHNYFHLDN